MATPHRVLVALSGFVLGPRVCSFWLQDSNANYNRASQPNELAVSIYDSDSVYPGMDHVRWVEIELLRIADTNYVRSYTYCPVNAGCALLVFQKHNGVFPEYNAIWVKGLQHETPDSRHSTPLTAWASEHNPISTSGLVRIASDAMNLIINVVAAAGSDGPVRNTSFSHHKH